MTEHRKNYYEELIDKMMIDEVLNEEVHDLLQNNSNVKKKRIAILSALEDNNKQKTFLFNKIKSLINNNDVTATQHIQEVVTMLRDYVAYGDVEKKKFGEVMTPISLVEEMLDTLPIEVWTNPDLKWLDPANGVGIFPAIVVQRLMEGLVDFESCEEKRYAHIMENMLYVCELQPKNMFLYLCGFDPEDKYELNIYSGSFLDDEFDEHMSEVYGVEKFDIVIGNPPYNQTIDLKFLTKSYQIANKILFVHPSTWLIDEKNKQLKFIKTKTLVNDGLKSIRLFNGNPIFGIGLFVPCTITYIDKLYNGKIKMIDYINNRIIEYDNVNDINKYNTKEYLSIKEKILNVYEGDSLLNHKNILHGKYFVNLAQIRGHVNTSKIENKSMILDDFYTFIPKDLKVETENTKHMFYSFSTENEANNFIKYLKSNIARFCLSIYKMNSQLDRGELKAVPYLDFNVEWNDNNIKEFFNITNDEYIYIESIIPKYY